MRKAVIRISQLNKDVKRLESKYMLLDSEFDSMKIIQTGVLTVSAPSETLNDGDTTEHWGSVDLIGKDYKKIDYVPFFLPCIKNLETDILSSPVNLDSWWSEEVEVPHGGYSPPLYLMESVDTYATTGELKIRLRREYHDPYGIAPSHTFSAKTVNVQYIAFYIEGTKEADLTS